MEDTFLTIASASEGIYKEKGSKFLAYAYPVRSEDEIKQKVDALRKKYFDARHHCYAYRLGAKGEKYRTNDDGEPSNSAGKPILGQLLAYQVTNTLIIVVRYFGGILLGVGGLGHAYKEAAADALAHAEIVTDTITEVFRFTFDYPVMNQVLKVIKDMNLEYFDHVFDSSCTMKIRVKRSQIEEMQKRLELVESLQIEHIAY